MKYVDEINFVVLVLAVIAFAIATGLAHILTQALKKIERMEKAHAEEIKQLQAEKKRLVALSEDLHKTEFEHSQLLEQQRDEARLQRDNLAARQTVEIEATIPAKPTTKRNSKAQFEKKVENDG